MRNNIFAKALDYYQEKLDLKLKVIYDGVCSATDFTKVRDTGKDVDFLIMETLLARVGRTVEEFEFLAGDEDYELWLERLSIGFAMWNKNMPEVEERVTRYGELMPQDRKLHRQFWLYYKMKIAEWRRESADMIAELAEEALALTKSVEDMPREKQSLYTPMEMDLLLTLVHYKAGKWKEAFKAEYCLRNIIAYVEIYYSIERLEDIDGRAWMELLQLAEAEDDQVKLLDYIDKAISCFAKGTGISRLSQVHFKKAKLLARMKSGDGGAGKRRFECMEECRMAYCVCRVLEQEDNVEEITRFCLEELQWHITI